MLLGPHDLDLAFRLHRSFMFFANQRLHVLSKQPANAREYSSLPPKVRFQVHEAFMAHPEIIETFIAENPGKFSADELAIVASWKHFVKGRFLMMRQLQKHAIFLSTSDVPVAYGVVALSQPFEEFVGTDLPALIDTVLLPFKEVIIFDGLLTSHAVHFGGGMRRSFNETLKEAKAAYGVVTSLPQEQLAARLPRIKPKPPKPSKEDKDAALQDVLDRLAPFCKEFLNEEYAAMCGKMAEKLHRKRPSPLLTGKPNVWASAIVRAVGGVNFLHDSSQTPHMPTAEIDRHFGVASSTASAKATLIRKALDLIPFSPEWTLPSRFDSNPLVWMMEVNGFMMDIRYAPRAAQQVAFEKGLIPYIPADRVGGDER